jgi:hypothetical protein
MHQGGTENGHLTVTFRQFEDYGVPKHGVAAALRELVAVDFIEITERALRIS